MKHQTIVILTGAGISRDSGLHTFRDPDGIWASVRIEDVATPEAFARNPALVHEFYNARRLGLKDPSLAPNAAHLALTRLQSAWPGRFVLVTQNVDDLHERAGTRDVLHMHGQLNKARCIHCETVMDWLEDLSTSLICPRCARQGGLRPDIVWFGELPMRMETIEAALENCDLFIAIGTSGNVYPAAGFVAQVRRRAQTVELTLEPSEVATMFGHARYGRAIDIVPAYVDEILAGFRTPPAPR